MTTPTEIIVRGAKEALWRLLRPIIARDYRLRIAGLHPDRWHWADLLAIRCGFLERDDYPSWEKL